MNSIKEMLGSNPFGQEAVNLWKEYASDSTPDANFVKDLDKLELIIQAVEYEKSNKCGI
jgi:putative hydrolases of HD superfamily